MQESRLSTSDSSEERAEWCESVDGLIAVRGRHAPERLLAEVAAHARRRGAYLRWNAMAMVVRANKQHAALRGHLSTYASTLTLWEVGFRHFFRGLGEHHVEPQQLTVTSTVTLDEVDGKPTVVSSALQVRGQVPGLDADGFRAAVDDAAALCPISRLFAGATITVDATLE